MFAFPELSSQARDEAEPELSSTRDSSQPSVEPTGLWNGCSPRHQRGIRSFARAALFVHNWKTSRFSPRLDSEFSEPVH